MLEMRSTLEKLQENQGLTQPKKAFAEAQSGSLGVRPQSRGPNLDDIEPTDQHVHASPAEVVRKVGNQLSGGYRRTVDIQDDLISLGLLGTAEANTLIQS